MTQVYSDLSRKDDPHALPDIEVFYHAEDMNNLAREYDAGWYWWTCFPGCLPDGDPVGPFDTEALATADAQIDFKW